MNPTELSAKNKKFCIVVSRFNETISSKLLSGAKDCLLEHDCKEDDVTIVWVPGAFEIPLTAKKMASSKKFNAVICLGAVIRGETPHFDYISDAASKGIMQVGLDENLPVIFGVLTTDNIQQAQERSGANDKNKGRDAALCAMEMVNLYEKI